jgi:hypothetical protein
MYQYIVIFYREGVFLDAVEEGFYGVFDSEYEATLWADNNIDYQQTYRVIMLRQP